MFKQKDIDEYRSIKAPESLKARVLEMETGKKKISIYKFAQTAASIVAVFVLVFAAVSCIPAKVNYNGSPVNQEIVLNDGIAVARSGAEENAVEINAMLFSEIEVSNGYFEVIDTQSGKMIYSGSKYLASGNIILRVFPEYESAVLTVCRLFSERDILIKQ